MTAARRARLTKVKQRIELRPCDFATYDTKVLCGKYEVFEERAILAGRKIPLSIVVLPALDPKPASDPVFFLTGGPGQGAAKIASAGEDSLMSQLRRERDLVFIDQRGTGGSHPLDCDFSAHRASIRSYFGAVFPIDKVRACRAGLQKDADLRFYTTNIAMADLDEVRDVLGYQKINLYGVSYGALAALQYLRLHPRHVRALALAGVATPSTKLPLHFAKGAQAAIEQLFHDCAADENCGAVFPNLRDDFVKVLAQLDHGPVTFAALHPKSRELQEVSIARGIFAEHLKNLLYNLSSASLVPLVIHRAALGDWSTFVKIVTATSTSVTHTPSMGIYLAVTCSESVPFITEEEIILDTRGTFMGDYRTRAHQMACREWPRAAVPADYFEPVKSTVPVLMLSGELDGATPARFAADAAKLLPQSRQILLPNTAHGYASECVRSIIAHFIARGATEDLNTECVAKLSRPPFAKELPARYSR